MSRKAPKIPVHLHPEKINALPPEDIKMILRGADDLIARGGRTLLCRVLRGSKEKKVLELKLNQIPVYGCFGDLSNEEVMGKIDWLLANNYLRYEYDGRLPVLFYSPAGWEIEKETYTDELWNRFRKIVESEQMQYDFSDLKDRNREMIFLLLEKICVRGDIRYIPLLQSWREVDYKKVQERIYSVIRKLQEHKG
jgi:superfamily II DNA helicase RecQ